MNGANRARRMRQLWDQKQRQREHPEVAKPSAFGLAPSIPFANALPPEKDNIRIEVFDDEAKVLLIFPRKMDTFPMVWQEAYIFGETLDEAARSIPLSKQPMVIDPAGIELEQSKFHLGSDIGKQGSKGLVYLFFDWTDRIKMTCQTAKIVAAAIKIKAQDYDFFVNKHVLLTYKDGRTVPYNLGSPRKLFNLRG